MLTTLSPLSFAVIGGGSIGSRHARALQALGHQVTVYDPRSDRGLPLAPLLDNPRTTVAGLHHAWLVCTPYRSHLTWAQRALDLHLPVFVEKPLGAIEDLPAWQALLTHPAAPRLQVGYNLRHHPICRLMRTLAPVGTGTYRLACNMEAWPGVYGDPLLECSHEIDLALWLGAGAEVDSVVCGSTPHRYSILLGGEQYGTPSARVEIEADVPYYHRAWRVGRHGQHLEYSVDRGEALGAEMYHEEMVRFVELVRGGGGGPISLCTLAEGVQVLEVCERVQAMAREGGGPKAS